MVEVEMAHRDDVDRVGLEAGRGHRRSDRRTLVAPHRSHLVAEPRADTRLDEHPAGRRLDDEAIQRLEEPVVVIDLVGDELVPQDPRDRPEERRVGSERPGLDQRDTGPAPEIGRPARRHVSRRRGVSGEAFAGTSVCIRVALLSPGKFRWNADAVGSDWPWYFEPRAALPYGRSTALVIWK